MYLLDNYFFIIGLAAFQDRYASSARVKYFNYCYLFFYHQIDDVDTPQSS